MLQKSLTTTHDAGASDVERREVLPIGVEGHGMVGEVDHGGDHVLRREGNAVPVLIALVYRKRLIIVKEGDMM